MIRYAGYLALVCVLYARPALASQESAFHVDYRPHAGCADSSAFSSRIFAHTTRARLARPGERARHFSVQLWATAHGTQGRLVTRELDGSTSTRQVHGRHCGEVADALALIAAIVIDPNAALGVVSVASAPAPAPQPPVANVDEAWSWRGGMIVQAGVTTERIAPKLGTILLFGGELVANTVGLLAPALRLSGYRMQSDEIVLPQGRAQFHWTAARLSACPLRWPAFVTLRPCALADVGELVGQGYATQSPEEHTVRWIAVGLGLRAETLVKDTLVLELEGGALFPLVTERFFFDPDNTTAHELGPGLYAVAGTGVRFR
jgi:hypothetical protein